MLFILYVFQREMQPAEQQHCSQHLLNSLHEIQDAPPAHVHSVLDPSKRWNLKRAIACSLDVYVQAASNGTL